MGRQKIRQRIAKHMQRHKRFRRQKLRKLRLSRGRQIAGQIGALQITQRTGFGKILRHCQCNGQRAAQRIHDRGLQGRCQRITIIRRLNPLQQMHPFGPRCRACHQTRRRRTKPPPCANPGGPLRRGRAFHGLRNPRRMIKPVKHCHRRCIMLANIVFSQFHLVGCQAHKLAAPLFILLNKLPPEA